MLGHCVVVVCTTAIYLTWSRGEPRRLASENLAPYWHSTDIDLANEHHMELGAPDILVVAKSAFYRHPLILLLAYQKEQAKAFPLTSRDIPVVMAASPSLLLHSRLQDVERSSSGQQVTTQGGQLLRIESTKRRFVDVTMTAHRTHVMMRYR